ncbi:hypothetical protein [uncultured Formosa sp.]|uniref:XAC2610-related protein n=1 Tax=uncultured Formosa sp. TaxID=255435 RepID=UPI002612C6F2|nr:hypothetical protein [uncultured Formosa sp.]
MKTLFILFLITIPLFTIAQTDYNITSFSDNYIGKLHIDKGYQDDVFKRGTITIFDSKTNERLIEIESNAFTFNLDHDNQVKTNVLQLPYGEQSIIISQDFDFDGIDDLAIMDGQNSCYHGPSFQIYLQKNSGLVYSPDFTRLAQEYCGMFQVDYDTKTLHAMTKSGCCWHQYSEYKILNDKPVAFNILEESLNINGIFIDYSETNRINNQMVKETYSILDPDLEFQTIFAFSFKNGKRMNLIHTTNNQLFYVFTDRDNKVELYYSNNFIYNTNAHTLTFTNKSAQYIIHSNGITVKTPKRTINMDADPTTKEGDLVHISSLKLENTLIK